MKRKRYTEEQIIRLLKAHEAESAKLKKLLAERDLEIEVMKEINRKKW